MEEWDDRTHLERKAMANRFLFDLGLLNTLRQYGEPHLIGSYRMDMMASNDLDIDVCNDHMTLERLHDLSRSILTTFKPCWYEAKEEQTEAGKTVWFHGFETRIFGDLWNIDIWFFDDETIANAERYCDDLVEKVKSDPSLKDVTIAIKQDLLDRGLYGFGKYTSMDVYQAVFDRGVRSTDAFIIQSER